MWGRPKTPPQNKGAEMRQLDISKLSIVELKAYILDEQDKINLSTTNIRVLRNEIIEKQKQVNMVENNPTVVTGNCVSNNIEDVSNVVSSSQE
jgi:hypothetical protein